MSAASIQITGLGTATIEKASRLSSGLTLVHLHVPATSRLAVRRTIENVIVGLSGQIVCFHVKSSTIEFKLRARDNRTLDWDHPFMKLLYSEIKAAYDPSRLFWREIN